jgi:hypothetical protein
MLPVEGVQADGEPRRQGEHEQGQNIADRRKTTGSTLQHARHPPHQLSKCQPAIPDHEGCGVVRDRRGQVTLPSK